MNRPCSSQTGRNTDTQAACLHTELPRRTTGNMQWWLPWECKQNNYLLPNALPAGGVGEGGRLCQEPGRA